MPLRIQIIGIIVSLALLIIIAGIGTGRIFLQRSLIKLEQGSLEVVADIANTLVANRIDLLKSNVRHIAERIDTGNIKQFFHEAELIDKEFNGVLDFTDLTVIERTGEGENEQFKIIVSKGNFTVTEAVLRRPPAAIKRAFDGYSAISTTIPTGDDEQKIVFYICTPAGSLTDGKAKRILCATLDGLYFYNLLSGFRIWSDSGDIILCDSTGTLLASQFKEHVTKRVNYIEDYKSDPSLKSLNDLFSAMIEKDESGIGKSGNNTHVLRGVPRIGFYRPITNSTMGWSLCVTASIADGPIREAMTGLILTGCISTLLSVFIAIFASGYLVKPYREANLAKAAAEKASESKSSFLANVSHEMRTPLNAIIGLSELSIGSEDAKGEVAENLVKIYNSGMTLLGTINDLLDISKIEAGKFELIPIEYDVPSLINDTATLNNVRIGMKPIQFKLKVDANLPSRLIGDELRIKQVLNNLLSNAIKYTRQGQVCWSVYGERVGDKFYLVSEVTDTGIGIRAKDLPTLFTEYHQVDSKANRKIEGTGLGLALVKRMVNMVGGSISCKSEYGHGSTFTIKILQATTSSNDVIGNDVAYNLVHMRHSDSKLGRNARLTRLKIPYAKVLIVDDVQTNLDVARGMMKPYGMHIDCASSGQQAIDMIRAEKVRYNAIFMDHMMPGLDGIETTNIIREQIGTEYARTIPIIALTANAIVGNDEMFLAHGFQAFLSKPIDIMRLDVVIRHWVRDKTQETGTDSGMLAPSSASGSGSGEWRIDGLNKEKGERQLGNEETYLMVLQSYAVNTPELLEKLRTLCTESQLSDYALLAHGIKGSSYGICAEEVGKMAEALDYAARGGDFKYVLEHNEETIKAAEKLIDDINAMLKKMNIVS